MSMCDLQYPKQSRVLAKLDDSTPLAVLISTDNGGTITAFAKFSLSALKAGD